MRVLILHGYEGNAPGHWQTWLAEQLRADGHDVAYPDLPDPLHPDLDAWLRVLADLRGGEDDVVVCHSLACLLWLHHRARGGAPAQRVLLVAPPCPSAAITVPALAGFFPAPSDPELGRGARLVCTDDDPYCPEDAREVYAREIAFDGVELVAGAGHINADAGFGPWPWAMEWAQGAKKGVDA